MTVLELNGDPIIIVRVQYAIRSGRVEIDAPSGTADAVLVALAKALFATLATSVKVPT